MGPFEQQVLSGYMDLPGARSQLPPDAIVVRAPRDAIPRILRTYSLGTVGACLYEGEDVDVVPHRAKRRWEGLLVGCALEGSVTVTQQERAARLAPGKFVFYVGTSPYRVQAEERHRYLVVWVPFLRLGIRLADCEDIVARDMEPGPAAAVLSSVLGGIGRMEGPPAAPVAHHLGDAVTAAVRAVLAEGFDAGPSIASRLLFHRMIEWLEEHLGEADLSARRLADAHFISTRYVRKVFSDNRTQVGAYVRCRRLDRIREDLIDPMRSEETVAEVAARWGMRNASVLSRAFARQFGESPVRYRRRRLHLARLDPA
jgi:AraC-like DNA-binding protein